jgi:DNA-binding NtrC family response regulator
MIRVLVIDDDAALRFTLEAVLSDSGVAVTTCAGGALGIAEFEARGADVVLTDLAMPDVDGMAVLERIRALDSSIPVIMLTAHGSERLAVAAIKAGAYDYLPKPFDPEEILHAVQRGAETRALRLENARLRAEAAIGRPLVIESPALKRVMDIATRVATKDVTVLLTGESGSGKDVIATSIHAHSHRSGKPLIRVNAASIPEGLAESELFGHVKGAFTGAHAARQGYFQQADKGTLFIDEIGELALPVQAKILRTLQSGEVQPVGGRLEVTNVRLIAATHKDLAQAVRDGSFREDLFYRLNVVPLRVPALRERVEDIEPLARAFALHYAERYGMVETTIEPALMDAFRTHSWPGNVRELENAVARLVAITTDDKLTLSLWRSHMAESGPLSTQLTSANATNASSGTDPGPMLPLRARIETFERSIIEAEFLAQKGNQSESARRLGISRPALIEKLHKYGLIRR